MCIRDRLKNRSQLMRLPQIICAKNYLSIETINKLKKEIGVINLSLIHI